MKDHHHSSSPSPSPSHTHQVYPSTSPHPSIPPPSPTASLETTIQRVLSNAHAIYGSTRHLDVLTYRSTSSPLFTASVVEHNPQGRAYIHCCSAAEPSRPAAVEHLLVIMEDLVARLVEMEDGAPGSEGGGGGEKGRGIKECGWGWLPSTPQSLHAVVFGRQGSFGHAQQQAQHHQGGGSGSGSITGSGMASSSHHHSSYYHHNNQLHLQQHYNNLQHHHHPDGSRVSSFGSLPNLNALAGGAGVGGVGGGGRFDSAPVSRRESMVMGGGGGSASASVVAGGGRVEGTVSSSHSNVSTPMPHLNLLGGPGPGSLHGISGIGLGGGLGGGGLLHGPAGGGNHHHHHGGTAAAVTTAGGSGVLVVPRPRRAGEKVKWIMGSEG